MLIWFILFVKLSLDTCIERVKRDQGTPFLAPHGTRRLRENAAQWVEKVARISPGNTWEIGRHNKLWQRAFCCFLFGHIHMIKIGQAILSHNFFKSFGTVVVFHANIIRRWNLIPHQDTKQGGRVVNFRNSRHLVETLMWRIPQLVAPWGSYYDPSTYLPLPQHICMQQRKKGFNRENAMPFVPFYTPLILRNRNGTMKTKIRLVGFIFGDKKTPQAIWRFFHKTGSIGFHGFFGLPGSIGRYILFVTASKDGTVVVYRCYRWEKWCWQMGVGVGHMWKNAMRGGGLCLFFWTTMFICGKFMAFCDFFLWCRQQTLILWKRSFET